MDLYELTRKLVARGCPEHPRLFWGTSKCWWIINGDDTEALVPVDDDARAIWTMWALEWARNSRELGYLRFMETEDGWYPVVKLELSESATWGRELYARYGEDSALEAIEAATRHLEPK